MEPNVNSVTKVVQRVEVDQVWIVHLAQMTDICKMEFVYNSKLLHHNLNYFKF